MQASANQLVTTLYLNNVTTVGQLKYIPLPHLVDKTSASLGNLADHRRCNFGLHLYSLDSSHEKQDPSIHDIVKSNVPLLLQNAFPPKQKSGTTDSDTVLDAEDCLGQMMSNTSAPLERTGIAEAEGGQHQARRIRESL